MAERSAAASGSACRTSPRGVHGPTAVVMPTTPGRVRLNKLQAPPPPPTSRYPHPTREHSSPRAFLSSDYPVASP